MLNIKQAKLFDLYCIFDILCEDYYKFNNSVSGLYDYLYKIYSGIYKVLIYENLYAVCFITNNCMYVVFMSNKGKWGNFFDLFFNRKEIMKRFNVEKIVLRTEKNDLKKEKFISKISYESYLTHVIRN